MVFKYEPPQASPTWNHTPKELTTLVGDWINNDKAICKRIAALSPDECNFENLALAHSEIELDTVAHLSLLYKDVSASQELRESATEAASLFDQHIATMSKDLGVHKAKLNAKNNITTTMLSPEENRLVEKMILDGKRMGLEISEETERKTLESLQKELADHADKFNKNLENEKGFLKFTLEELEGVPADFISRCTDLEDDRIHFRVTFKEILPLLRSAKKPETRKLAWEGSENRLKDNADLLEKIFPLRRQIAELLGYSTWADHATEEMMVKNATNVQNFLQDLLETLRPVGEKEKQELLELKSQEEGSSDQEYYPWDYSYYEHKFLQSSSDFSMDAKSDKECEYFPVATLVPRVIEIYQDLFSIKFVEMTGVDAWHEDVQQYSVWKKDARSEEDFIGYCYLDLYPRDDKYTGVRTFTLVSGCEKPDGKRQFPVMAMVANLAKSTSIKRGLMHGDVVWFFHTFGHVIHGLLSRTRFSRFHGPSRVAIDFAEAYSQMLKDLAWEPTVLKKISSHYESGEPLPDELIEKLIKSRDASTGLEHLYYVFLATYDLKAHTNKDPAIDYTKLWNDLREEIQLVTIPKQGEVYRGLGDFDHMVNGHDGSFYRYIHSLVLGADMYATVFKGDPLNPASGKKYMESIFVPGGSRDESDSLTELLGRPPNPDALMRTLFGNSESSPVEESSQLSSEGDSDSEEDEVTGT